MVHVVIGAPCAGKSTYVEENAKSGDIRIDFDKLAQALGAEESHAAKGHVKQAAFKARQAAIDYCIEKKDECDSWIIHSKPSVAQLAAYSQCEAGIIVLDTDKETCLARAEADGRPPESIQAIHDYFEAAKAAFLMPEKGGEMQLKKICAKSSVMESAGYVTGYASTFDRDPDAYGDVIAKGAFAKSLDRWKQLNEEGRYIPLLWGHDTDNPESNIGKVVEAYEDERGLFVKAEFDADNPRAQYVRKLVQEGRVYQFSFAFEVRDWGTVELEDGAKANELREIELFEVSIVQIPANQHATVEEIKAAKAGRRNSAKDAAELERIGALAEEIKEVVNGLTTDNEAVTDGDTESEAKAEGETVQAEFAAAYKQAIKTYLEV